MQAEQNFSTQQSRLQNINNLAQARQTFTADKNYRGSLHKRERDNMWATKRENDHNHTKRNSQLASFMKTEVNSQMY